MFGKILVCLHTGLSFVLATWAMVLYVTRVDFTDTKGKAPQPDGELVARREAYERLMPAKMASLDGQWRANRTELEKKEEARLIERPWYDDQIEFVRTRATQGGVGKVRNEVRAIERNVATGKPNYEENPKRGDPVMKTTPVVVQDKGGAKQPLFLGSLKEYNDRRTALNGIIANAPPEITLALEKLKKEAVDDFGYTEKLKDSEKDGKMVRGLAQQLALEAKKQERLRDEYEEVRTLSLKTRVELQTLVQLRSRLEERLKELRGSRGGQ